ncbi:GspE/PulE family protein [Acetobacter syzygii]|uniref:Bacterial type II secretion system protein E domain-containing protein n=1 Tax=Acetobacter syzygii TaxID=146476 RepID=A0A270B751_9PROT|nr:ATPase, T2SS/T4P/T4SS family [Acetobacter syzygii]NSL92697.1 Flp pilus assembly complex ATPase component TadA [Acetobacter syzygii]PAL20842.1 hypothetical protein B9K05_12565 [Acetobacter syzygii]PAL22933.1 hypothetical protein B9K04_12505 [Acetobacter syzygii]
MLKKFFNPGKSSQPAKLNIVRVPMEFEGRIFIDTIAQTIMADEKLKRKTNFLEWLDDAHSHPSLHHLKIIWAPISHVSAEIEKDHHHGDGHKHVEDDAEARDHALALLREAASYNASDIHIHRQANHTEISFRVNGKLGIAHEYDNNFADHLIPVLYTLCRSRDASQSPMEFQDGSIPNDELTGTGIANVRVVKGPCYPVTEGGQFMILREQYARTGSTRKNDKPLKPLRTPRRPEGTAKFVEFGLSEDQIERIQRISMAPSGVLLCTGPTGSGKTTLLFEVAADKARKQPGRRLITIEQPVEYPMPWAIQLEISNALDAEKAGAEFKARLRNALRMDPNDMIIGEIRDAEVALTVIDAAQTGHFVMSTLHVDDAFDYPLRLRNMDDRRLGFDTTCNASVVRGIVAQRLVPLLCPHCSIPWKADDDRMPRSTNAAVLTWGDNRDIIRRIGPGCEHCHGTGTHDRTAVAEIIETDEELMSDFVQFSTSVARHRFRARKGVDPSMVETALKRVFTGKVDPFDVLTEVDQIRPRDVVMEEREKGARL